MDSAFFEATATMSTIPRHVTLPSGWEAEVFQTWDIPAEVVDQWRTLVSHQGDLAIFLGYDWLRNWWSSFGGTDTLLVIVLKENGDIRAIFPLRISSRPKAGNGKPLVASLTNDHSCHYDFLIQPNAQELALANFISLLPQVAKNADVILEHLKLSGSNWSVFLRHLRRHAFPVYIENYAWGPWLSVSGDIFQTYEKLSGHFKSNLRRYRKKAEAKGKLRIEVIKCSDNLDNLLDILFEIEYRSWKGREGTAIRCSAETEHFYRRVGNWAMKERYLLLFVLWLTDIPIAASFCLQSGKTVFQLKVGYDESFAPLAPGKILHQDIVNYLLSCPDVQIYNFLGPCDQWKMEWTSNSEEIGAIKIYPASFRGWSRYAAEHGWKDLLKQSATVRQIKACVDRKRESKRAR